MAGDDLEGALTSQVQAGEDGQDGLGEEEEADSEGEVRGSSVPLIFICILAIWYFNSFIYLAIYNPETSSSGPQTESRSEESEKMTTGEKTIQTSSRTDRSGHSVLQTLGQAQGGGDDGGGVGCEEFSSSVVYGRVLIEYNVA